MDDWIIPDDLRPTRVFDPKDAGSIFNTLSPKPMLFGGSAPPLQPQFTNSNKSQSGTDKVARSAGFSCAVVIFRYPTSS